MTDWNLNPFKVPMSISQGQATVHNFRTYLLQAHGRRCNLRFSGLNHKPFDHERRRVEVQKQSDTQECSRQVV